MHARCSVQVDAPLSQLDGKRRGMRSVFLPALNRFIGNKPRVTATAKVASARVRPATDVAFVLIRNAKRVPIEFDTTGLRVTKNTFVAIANVTRRSDSFE